MAVNLSEATAFTAFNGSGNQPAPLSRAFRVHTFISDGFEVRMSN